MTKIVPGTGPQDAPIAIIGEAPGTEELIQGKPFVGTSGRLLDRWLQAAGIMRDQCYIDNVIQRKPRGKFEDCFYKDKQPTAELLAGRERVKETLRSIESNVIVLLGEEALRAVAGKQGITDWRGSIIPTDLGKAIPIVHPAAVRRKWNWSPLCILDMKRVAVESKTPVYTPPFNWDNIVVPVTPEDAIQEIEHAIHAPYIALDIETRLHSPAITHFGFAPSPDYAVSISFVVANEKTLGLPRYELAEEIAIWDAIAALCANKSRKIVQNAVFDIPILNRIGIVVENFWMDTMIAHTALFPEIPRGLETLTSIYTDIPYYYDLKHQGSVEYCLYNALDCLAAYRVAMRLDRQLRAFGTDKLYFRVLHPVLGPAIHMQERGIKCDLGWRANETRKLEEKLLVMQRTLNELAGEEINTNSPTQMINFLYEKRGIPPILHRKTRRPTTNEDALETLARKHDIPETRLIVLIRYLRKLLGTYYKGALDDDNRIRCSWNVGGTVTGRWSSTKTWRNTGMDLQNVPVPERRQFIADEGKIFLYADLRQVEARFVAWLSKERHMQAAFNEGKDIHRVNATSVFPGVSYDNVPPALRQAAKHLGHAANYGVGARSFLITMRQKTVLRGEKLALRGVTPPDVYIPQDTNEAKALLDSYYAHWVRIKAWHAEVKEELRRTRSIDSPFGRKRMFFGPLRGTRGAATIRKAIDYRPQSGTADLINLGIISLYASLPEGAEILLQNHDAILVQCSPDQEGEVRTLIKRAMEIKVLGDMVVPVEIKKGTNWGELVDVEEEEEL